MSLVPRRLWQLAGVLALIHVALIPVGIFLSQPALFSDGTAGIEQDYARGNLERAFTGGMIEAFGFVLLVPALTFLGRVLGRRDEASRWAATTGTACGLAYVAVTLAVGLPAGAASMYGVHHGLDLDTAFAFNNVRIFAYFLSLMLLGGAVLGYAFAALADGLHRRWFGWFGVVTGLALLVSTPLSTIGQQDWGTLVFMVWFVGVGVLMVRHREAPAITADSPARQLAVGHS